MKKYSDQEITFLLDVVRSLESSNFLAYKTSAVELDEPYTIFNRAQEYVKEAKKRGFL